MNSRATQLKFWCPRISHYSSHYHYGSQSIAFSGQWECWTGWSQPVNCINLHKHRTPHCTAEWTYCLFPILCYGPEWYWNPMPSHWALYKNVRLSGNCDHWALLFIWRLCSRLKAQIKNMADLTSQFPYFLGAIHWPRLMLKFLPLKYLVSGVMHENKEIVTSKWREFGQNLRCFWLQFVDWRVLEHNLQIYSKAQCLWWNKLLCGLSFSKRGNKNSLPRVWF